MTSQVTPHVSTIADPSPSMEERGWENIPPSSDGAATGASRPKVPVQAGDGGQSLCLAADMGTPDRESISPCPGLHSSCASTPAVYCGNAGVKGKPHLSKPRSVLTPLFKSLNLGAKPAAQSQPLRSLEDTELDASYLYETIPSDCSQLRGLLFGPSATPVRAASRTDQSDFLLEDETLPNCTGLDFTLNSPAVPASGSRSTSALPRAPLTPVPLKELDNQLGEDSLSDADTHVDATRSLHLETSSVLTVQGDASGCLRASLDITQDQSPETVGMNCTQDITMENACLKPTEDKGNGSSHFRASLDVTQDQSPVTAGLNCTQDVATENACLKSTEDEGNVSSHVQASLDGTRDLSTATPSLNCTRDIITENACLNTTEDKGTGFISCRGTLDGTQDLSTASPGLNSTQDISKAKVCLNTTEDKGTGFSGLRASLDGTQDLQTASPGLNSTQDISKGKVCLNTTEDKGTGFSGLRASLDGTQDLSTATPSLNSTQDISKAKVCLNITKDNGAGLSSLQASLDGTQDLPTEAPSLNSTQDISKAKVSLKATEDKSYAVIECRPVLGLTGQNEVEMCASAAIQSSNGDSPGALDGNVMHGDSSSSQKSFQSTTCDVKSNNDTFNLEEIEECTAQPQPGIAVTRESPQLMVSAVESLNSSLHTEQGSPMSTPISLHGTAETACTQNTTFSLCPSNGKNTTREIGTNVLTTGNSCHSGTFVLSPTTLHSVADKTKDIGENNVSLTSSAGTCPDLIQKSLAVAGSASHSHNPNNTFNKSSAQKLNGTTTLVETSTVAANLQDSSLKTDSVPQLTVPTSLPKTASSDATHSNAPDGHSLPKPSGTTDDHHNSTLEAHRPELAEVSSLAAEMAPDVQMDASESHPDVATKSSQSNLPVADKTSDSLHHQSLDVEMENAGAFNLDGTLELVSEPCLTSTPMPCSKGFHLGIDQKAGRAAGGQKWLEGGAPAKPTAELAIPSNIVSDRKTFLKVPIAKSALPTAPGVPQLMKRKPGLASQAASSLLPPMTTRRAYAEASKKPAATAAIAAAAASTDQETTSIPTSSKGHRAIPVSKLPASGMKKPLASGIPSGTQRSIPTLKPPAVKGQSAASNTSVATRSMVKTSSKVGDVKKHLLTSTEALPAAKRKKIDDPVEPSTAKPPAASGEQAVGGRSLKRPGISVRPPATKGLSRPNTKLLSSTTSMNTSVKNQCQADASVSRSVISKQPPNTMGECAQCALLKQELSECQRENVRLKEELARVRQNRQEENGHNN